MPLEYIKRIKLRYSWLYKEIQYRRELRHNHKKLLEFLRWVEEELEKEQISEFFIWSKEDLANKEIPKTKTIDLLLEHKANIVKEISNIQLNIKYTNNRIQYYTEISQLKEIILRLEQISLS